MPPQPSRRTQLLAAALLALHGGLAWAGRSMVGVGTNEDGAIYVLLSQALRHGRYINEYLAARPPHTLYPPGYPALLGIWTLASTSVDWLIILGIASSVVALALSYVVYRRADPMISLVILAALAVNSDLVARSGRLFSEATYMALSVGALWAATHDTRRANWVAGALGIGAALTRSIGITVLPALGLTFLLRRRYRALGIFVLASVLTVGGWHLYVMRTSEQAVERSYAQDFRHTAGTDEGARQSLPLHLLARVRQNARAYGWSLPYHLGFPAIPGTPVDNALALLLGLGGLALGLFALWRVWRPALFYLLCYGALLIVWPWPVSRFLDPLVPVLVVAFLLGWMALANRVRPALGRPVALALGIVLVAGGAVRTASLLGDAAACERGHTPPHPSCLVPEQDTYLRAVTFLQDSTPVNTIVLSARPGITYYYGQRRTVPVLVDALPPADRLIPFLRARSASYILLGSIQANDPIRLAPQLERVCDRLSVRKAFPPYTYVLDLRAEPREGGDACAALDLYRAANRGQDFAVRP